MYEQIEKPKENKGKAVANSVTQKKSDGKQGFGFVDNRLAGVKGTILHKEEKNNNMYLIQRKGGGDVFPILGAIGGGLIGGGVGAVGGMYAGEGLRSTINNFRNRNTGYKVSLLTSGGFTRGTFGERQITNEIQNQETVEIPKPLAVATGGYRLFTGHVSLRLESSHEVHAYEMGANGVEKIDPTFGSSRETHNITESQYNLILARMKGDQGKKQSHTNFDMNLLRRTLGKKETQTVSCAGWAMSVLRGAGVPAGSWIDRNVFAMPRLIAQSGWRNFLRKPNEKKND